MSVTAETRKESFEVIKATLPTRQEDVLSNLATFTDGVTAGELAMHMWDKNFVALPDRNSVHPRLTELVVAGLVVVDGKRKCSITGRTCSIYKIGGFSYETK